MVDLPHFEIGAHGVQDGCKLMLAGTGDELELLCEWLPLPPRCWGYSSRCCALCYSDVSVLISNVTHSLVCIDTSFISFSFYPKISF